MFSEVEIISYSIIDAKIPKDLRLVTFKLTLLLLR